MARNRKPPDVPAPKTAGYIKKLASEGLARPSKLKAAQIQELAASVMGHIEPRSNNAKTCDPTPKRKGRLSYTHDRNR